MNKKNILMLLALFSTISYVVFSRSKFDCHTDIRTIKKATSDETAKSFGTGNNKANIAAVKKKTDAMILLTTMRSGSSIVGSIFNERHNVTYLYEPLFPFGDLECGNKTRYITVALLRSASTCHFENFEGLYQSSKRNDKWARCKIHNVCFVGPGGKYSKFISRDAGICKFRNGFPICPVPVDPVPLNKHCKKSLLVAMKVIYLCKLEWLVPLLEDPDVNVKVVHLVRDPRSTVNSRTNHGNTSLGNIKHHMNEVCTRLQPDLNFAENVLKKSIVQQKYMRIRYEDFALNPIGKTLKIYDFIGINMTIDVKEWLDEATSVKDTVHISNQQGLKRNVKSVLNAWRKELSFEAVQMIQHKCEQIFNVLGYTLFKSEKDLKDLSKPYFNPNWH